MLDAPQVGGRCAAGTFTRMMLAWCASGQRRPSLREQAGHAPQPWEAFTREATAI
ncbi:MAG: hypothetical protein R2705_09310 [Ilumatobacteraceae bacterium]